MFSLTNVAFCAMLNIVEGFGRETRMELEDKIRRRLKPFVVEGRIREPAIRSVSGDEAGGAFEVDIAPEEKAFAPSNLERDLRAALSDLAPLISLRLNPLAS
jgi:hypothetical protein